VPAHPGAHERWIKEAGGNVHPFNRDDRDIGLYDQVKLTGEPADHPL
jgi:hypothetical protein